MMDYNEPGMQIDDKLINDSFQEFAVTKCGRMREDGFLLLLFFWPFRFPTTMALPHNLRADHETR